MGISALLIINRAKVRVCESRTESSKGVEKRYLLSMKLATIVSLRVTRVESGQLLLRSWRERASARTQQKFKTIPHPFRYNSKREEKRRGVDYRALREWVTALLFNGSCTSFRSVPFRLALRWEKLGRDHLRRRREKRIMCGAKNWQRTPKS